MRLRSFVAAALVAALAASASAAPVGPVRPRSHRFAGGLEASFGLGRDWESTANREDVFQTDRRYAYLGRISYGWSDSWEVFGRLGAASLRVEDRPDGVSGANSLYDMGTEFAWGAGMQGIVWEEFLRGWDLALHAQYFEHQGHDGFVTDGTNFGVEAREWDQTEWALALLFQSGWRDWSWWAGPTFGDAEIEIATVARRDFPDLEADDHVGIVFGTGYDFGDGWFGFAEGRLIDETALNVGMYLSF